jgi:fructose-bisphosphate aldolase class I
MELAAIAKAMVAEGKGILAIDESAGTCKKRFDSIEVECTAQNRRDYRGMLLSTPGLGEHISGAILFDETLRQSSADGIPFVQLMTQAGILPGIKVDKGAHPCLAIWAKKSPKAWMACGRDWTSTTPLVPGSPSGVQ